MNRRMLLVTALWVMVNGIVSGSLAQLGHAESRGKPGKPNSNRPTLTPAQPKRAIATADRASVKFQPPPPPDAPTRRPRGTASRGRCASSASISANEPTVTLIVPESNWGLTQNEFPTLWATVSYPLGKAEPEARAYELDVRPMNGALKPIQFPVQIPDTTGTFKIDLPFSLQPNQGYRLYLVQKCDPQVSVVPELILFESFIQRVGPAALPLPAPPKSPQERIAFFAEKGVWFDAFDEAAQFACQKPTNVPVEEDYWKTLLRDRTVNLDAIADLPLPCQ